MVFRLNMVEIIIVWDVLLAVVTWYQVLVRNQRFRLLFLLECFFELPIISLLKIHHLLRVLDMIAVVDKLLLFEYCPVFHRYNLVFLMVDEPMLILDNLDLLAPTTQRSQAEYIPLYLLILESFQHRANFFMEARMACVDLFNLILKLLNIIDHEVIRDERIRLLRFLVSLFGW